MEGAHDFLTDGDVTGRAPPSGSQALWLFFFFLFQNELSNVKLKPQKNLVDTTLFLSSCECAFYFIVLLVYFGAG